MRLTARIANAIRGVLPSPRIVSQSKFRRGSRVRVVDGRLEVGSGVTILRNGEFQGKVSIGDGTFINRDAYIRDGTRIGCFVSIGPFVRIITDGHEIGESGRRAGKSFGSPVVVGDGAWIGASVVILGGVSVGRGSVVAAGSVVIRDVPANTLVAGVPARVVRELDS